ncbi:Hypothetical_protein [Hexamita inflata]|uniref:Hypothetical_protein n=1 Tax=Hexamita inflata TaxID=28002 RepID=A0AA86QDG3_9EUKA|nr:Hypothetical protein HINF_LOCUS43633 [Hexamita inflata]
MRLGQIGCGRQNPPVQSAELPSRIGMAKGMPSTNLQDWKAATAPLLPQKRRWYDAGGFPYRSARTKQPRYAPGCLYPSRWLPWLRRCAQRTQVYLKLMIIRVNLQFLYRRPNQYKRKLSEWDIYIYILVTYVCLYVIEFLLPIMFMQQSLILIFKRKLLKQLNNDNTQLSPNYLHTHIIQYIIECILFYDLKKTIIIYSFNYKIRNYPSYYKLMNQKRFLNFNYNNIAVSQ